MERLYWFTLELQDGPLAPGNESLLDQIAAANPDVVFSRFEGRELARYSRVSTSLENAAMQAMREIRDAVPGAHLKGIIERSPCSPAAVA